MEVICTKCKNVLEEEYKCHSCDTDWIKVKDKLPEYDIFVLISTEGDRTKKPPTRLTPHVAARISTDKNGENWICDSGDEPVGYITHWMPLPEPPK